MNIPKPNITPKPTKSPTDIMWEEKEKRTNHNIAVSQAINLAQTEILAQWQGKMDSLDKADEPLALLIESRAEFYYKIITQCKEKFK